MHRLTLIAAAATAGQRRGVIGRDEPIEADADLGLVSLATLGRIDHVLTSPARAARQTAEALGLAAGIAPALADLDLGSWSGRSLGEIGAAAPDDVALWLKDETAAPHGGESRAGLAARVVAFLDDRAAARGHSVAITHGAVIRLAVMTVLNAPASAFWHIDAAPLAKADLRFDGRRWALRSLG